MGFGPVAKDALSGIQRPPLTRMCSPAAAAFGAQCDLEAAPCFGNMADTACR